MQALLVQFRGLEAKDEAPPDADVEADDLDFNSYVVTRSSHMP